MLLRDLELSGSQAGVVRGESVDWVGWLHHFFTVRMCKVWRNAECVRDGKAMCELSVGISWPRDPGRDNKIV
jgi:hypothetical protein